MTTEDLIKELTQTLLEKLAVKAEVKISEDKDNQVFNLQIETEESGFLIGYHGETLSALQLVISLMVYRKLGVWARIVINVGDYRERREEHLQKLALSVAQKVKFTGEAQMMSNLSPSERRVIHLALLEDPDVYSESEGEGEDRRLVVKPRHLKTKSE